MYSYQAAALAASAGGVEGSAENAISGVPEASSSSASRSSSSGRSSSSVSGSSSSGRSSSSVGGSSSSGRSSSSVSRSSSSSGRSPESRAGLTVSQAISSASLPNAARSSAVQPTSSA